MDHQFSLSLTIETFICHTVDVTFRRIAHCSLRSCFSFQLDNCAVSILLEQNPLGTTPPLEVNHRSKDEWQLTLLYTFIYSQLDSLLSLCCRKYAAFIRFRPLIAIWLHHFTTRLFRLDALFDDQNKWHLSSIGLNT